MMSDEEEEPSLITFDLQMEVYLKGREDAILSMMEIVVSAHEAAEHGVDGLMEMCLEQFMFEIDRKSNPYAVIRSGEGMRQVFWENEIQSVSLLAPDKDRIATMIEEALNNG